VIYAKGYQNSFNDYSLSLQKERYFYYFLGLHMDDILLTENLDKDLEDAYYFLRLEILHVQDGLILT